MDPTLLLSVVCGLSGLFVGSYLSRVIYRMPLGVASLTRSVCPECASPLRKREQLPLVSWLASRARCRHCSRPISVRYPLMELLTAALFAALAAHFGARPALLPALIAYLFFAAIAVALSFIDLATYTLPNALVVPGLVVGLLLLTVAAAVSGEWPRLVQAVSGGGILFACYFAFALIYPSGMGFGDVKLAAVIGLYLGWVGWGALAVGAVSAFLLGGMFSVLLLVLRRAGRKTGIPFGPWMLAGAFVGIFFGSELAASYLALLGFGAS
ncbi:MAG: prepilin peptidase [Microbacteriaceae bacterium]|nr:prepilin peptidase [Microbacteriaceae bacterium]